MSGFRARLGLSVHVAPSVVGALLIANIAVYILIAIVGGFLLVMNGEVVRGVASIVVPDYSGALFLFHRRVLPVALNGYEVLSKGMWWELLTSMFVHANILHITFNMLALASIGGTVEAMMGRKKLLTAYFLGGLLGGLLTIVMNPYVYSVGASGALFSVIGMLAMYEYARYGSTRALSWAVMIFVVSSFGFGGVVNVLAHVGGLAVGLVLGLMYGLRPRRYRGYYVTWSW